MSPEPELVGPGLNACGACCLTFSGPAQLAQHLSGRKHRAAQRRAAASAARPSQPGSPVVVAPRVAAAGGRASVPHWAAASAAQTVPGKLTVIITTSPCKGGDAIHRALFRALFASFGQVDGLEGCRIIVVCDSYKQVKSDAGRPMGKVKVKNGSVTSVMAAGYADFLSWLDAEAADAGGAAGHAHWLSRYRVELLRLTEWRGWSSAVEHALQIVRTPFVMVIQDDRVFVPRYRELGLLLDSITLANNTSSHAAVADIDSQNTRSTFDGPVGYVLLPTNKFQRHENEMRSLAGQHHLKLAPDQLLLPLAAAQVELGTSVAATSEPQHESQPRLARTSDQSSCIPAATEMEQEVTSAAEAVWGHYGARELLNRCVTAVTLRHSRDPPSESSVQHALRLDQAAAVATPALETVTSAEAAEPVIRLLRCWRLLDTTHVASVEWYHSLYERFPELSRKGIFAEDCLSARHVADSLGGQPWATWVLAATLSSDDEPGAAQQNEQGRDGDGGGGAGDTVLATMVAHTDRGHANEQYSRLRQISSSVREA